MCLTKQTSNALSLTLNGMVVLIKRLCPYRASLRPVRYDAKRSVRGRVWNIQTAKWRKFSHVKLANKNSLKLQRIKNFDRLNIYETVVHYDRVLFR